MRTRTRLRITRRGWLVLSLVLLTGAVVLLAFTGYRIHTEASVGTDGASLIAVVLLMAAWLALAIGGVR